MLISVGVLLRGSVLVLLSEHEHTRRKRHGASGERPHCGDNGWLHHFPL
jgi:hypothetical protein